MKADILCVCTAGRDRSRALAEFLIANGFRADYCGISRFHTKRAGKVHAVDWIRHHGDPLLVLCVTNIQQAYMHGFYEGGSGLVRWAGVAPPIWNVYRWSEETILRKVKEELS